MRPRTVFKPQFWSNRHHVSRQVCAERGGSARIAEGVEQTHVRAIVVLTSWRSSIADAGLTPSCAKLPPSNTTSGLTGHCRSQIPPVRLAGREVSSRGDGFPPIIVRVRNCRLICASSEHNWIPRLGQALYLFEIIPIRVVSSDDVAPQVTGGQNHQTSCVATTDSRVVHGRRPRGGATRIRPTLLVTAIHITRCRRGAFDSARSIPAAVIAPYNSGSF